MTIQRYSKEQKKLKCSNNLREQTRAMKNKTKRQIIKW